MLTTTRLFVHLGVLALAVLVGASPAPCRDEHLLEVRVRDRDGAAVTQLAFERYRADGDPDRPVQTIRTKRLEAADGVYRLTFEEAGTWALRPTQEWARFVTPDLQPWDTFVEVPAAAPLELVLLRPASATGLVLDADGAPVSAAPMDITLHDARGIDWQVSGAVTDARGNFDFDTLPATLDGEWVTLGVSRPETQARVEHRLQPRSGERIEGLVLTFATTRTLAGVVRGKGGAPAGNVAVTLWRAVAPTFEPLEAWSGDDGRFVFELLVPGRYRVVADYGEVLDLERFEATAYVDVDLTSAPRAEVVVEPIEFHGLSIAGELTAAAGVPVEHLLHFVAEGAGLLGSRRACTTDADGRFATHLAPGKYAVIADAAEFGGLIDLGRVMVSDEAAPLALAIPTGALRGRVVDDEGAPVVDARVHALRLGGELTNAFVGFGSRTCTTDGEGVFSFESVEAGVWTVALGDLLLGDLGVPLVNVTLGVGEAQRDLVLRQVPTGSIALELAAGFGTTAAAAGERGPAELMCLVRDATGVPRAPFRLKLVERSLELPPGVHSIQLSVGADVTGWSEPHAVVAGKELELRFVLSPGAWLSLRCEEALPAEFSLHDGKGDVSPMRAAPEFPCAGPTWSGREARFGPLPPGRCTARARCGDGLVLERVLDLAVGARTEVALTRE